MKDKYIRTLQHQYYIVYKEPDEAEGLQAGKGSLGLEEQMLVNNKIEGILPLRIELVNNEKQYYFTVDGMQPLSNLYDKRTMGWEAVGGLLSSILETAGSCGEYFLEEDGFVITKDTVFSDIGGGRVGLVYLPGHGRALRAQLLGLLEYIMDKLEYSDSRASYVTYSVYARCRQEGSTLQELSDIVAGSRTNPLLHVKTGKNIQDEGCIKQDRQDSAACKRTGENAAAYCIQAENPGKPVFDELMTGGMAAASSKHDAISAGMWARVRALLSGFIEKIKKHCRSSSEPKREYSEIPGNAGFEQDSPEEAEHCEAPTVLMSYTEDMRELCRLQGRDGDICVYELPFYIGKTEKNMDYCIMKPEISRFHAKLTRQGEDLVLTDLNSANGTFVNGERLEVGKGSPIADGDVVSFAKYEYTVVCRQA